jgi:hypothetical protein
VTGVSRNTTRRVSSCCQDSAPGRCTRRCAA